MVFIGGGYRGDFPTYFWCNGIYTPIASGVKNRVLSVHYLVFVRPIAKIHMFLCIFPRTNLVHIPQKRGNAIPAITSHSNAIFIAF